MRWHGAHWQKNRVADQLTAAELAPIVNHMVNYSDNALDRTFAALADPTRRALVARLGEQDNLSVSELARPFPVSLPAIMKHLDVLSDAGLIARSKSGRTVHCRLTAASMEAAMDWLRRYEHFWSDRLSRLAAFLEEEDPCPPSPPPSQASPSSAATTPRRPRSTRPGPTRKS
jgi:DNA-binding transcriptional ArsR family regulator